MADKSISAGTQATYGELSSRVPSGHLHVGECETVSQIALAPHSSKLWQGSVQLPLMQAVPIVQSLLKWQPF